MVSSRLFRSVSIGGEEGDPMELGKWYWRGASTLIVVGALVALTAGIVLAGAWD